MNSTLDQTPVQRVMSHINEQELVNLACQLVRIPSPNRPAFDANASMFSFRGKNRTRA